jgi:hypothetical protein
MRNAADSPNEELAVRWFARLVRKKTCLCIVGSNTVHAVELSRQVTVFRRKVDEVYSEVSRKFGSIRSVKNQSLSRSVRIPAAPPPRLRPFPENLDGEESRFGTARFRATWGRGRGRTVARDHCAPGQTAPRTAVILSARAARYGIYQRSKIPYPGDFFKERVYRAPIGGGAPSVATARLWRATSRKHRVPMGVSESKSAWTRHCATSRTGMICARDHVPKQRHHFSATFARRARGIAKAPISEPAPPPNRRLF